MLDNDCLFCKIIKGEIPSAKVYEDEEMHVFKDIAPKAKVHLLAVPKDHYKLLSEMDESRAETLSHILAKLPEIAEKNGCDNGYRLIVNQGDDAGQTVFHLHVHILGGENLPFE
ncbi:MAG: histidine triad nucleotide-binding protein [Clostridia bacterium]|nr:histidine triad nucleotide-binding protein [Clostridia bacterium]